MAPTPFLNAFDKIVSMSTCSTVANSIILVVIAILIRVEVPIDHKGQDSGDSADQA